MYCWKGLEWCRSEEKVQQGEGEELTRRQDAGEKRVLDLGKVSSRLQRARGEALGYRERFR